MTPRQLIFRSRILSGLLVLFAVLAAFANCFANDPSESPPQEATEQKLADDEWNKQCAKEEKRAQEMVDQYPGQKVYFLKMRFYETNANAKEKEHEQLLITRWALGTPQDAIFCFGSSSDVALSKSRSTIHATKPHCVNLSLEGIVVDMGQGNICIKTKTFAKKAIDGVAETVGLPKDTKEVAINTKLKQSTKFQLTADSKDSPLKCWCEMIVVEVMK